jgi:hypothetical protein
MARSVDPIISRGRVIDRWNGFTGIRIINGYLKGNEKTMKGEIYYVENSCVMDVGGNGKTEDE